MRILIYRLLVVPITVIFILPLLCIFSSKARMGLRLRTKKQNPPEFKERSIWIHAASGEFEYAKPLIRLLKGNFPQIPIVVTYFSPTFASSIENTQGVDFSLALPLDLPGSISSFLKKINPRIGLFARTDLWPELLHQCKARDIPTLLFSCTQKPIPESHWLKRFLLRWNYSMLRQIHCVSAEDQEQIASLGVETEVKISGDTRYDQVGYRLQHPKPLKTSLASRSGVPVLVAGSTWWEDERVLLPAVTKLLKAQELRLILVPHEPSDHHIEQIQKTLKQLDLEWNLYSSDEAWTNPVLLVNQVGILAELYQWGHFGFVGGSFKKTVHSVMESLAAGLPTLVGPLYQNNREAIEFQNVICQGIPAVQPSANAKQLKLLLKELIEAREKMAQFKFDLQSQIKRRTGASERIIQQGIQFF